MSYVSINTSDTKIYGTLNLTKSNNVEKGKNGGWGERERGETQEGIRKSKQSLPKNPMLKRKYISNQQWEEQKR